MWASAQWKDSRKGRVTESCALPAVIRRRPLEYCVERIGSVIWVVAGTCALGDFHVAGQMGQVWTSDVSGTGSHGFGAERSSESCKWAGDGLLDDPPNRNGPSSKRKKRVEGAGHCQWVCSPPG